MKTTTNTGALRLTTATPDTDTTVQEVRSRIQFWHADGRALEVTLRQVGGYFNGKPVYQVSYAANRGQNWTHIYKTKRTRSLFKAATWASERVVRTLALIG